MCVRSVVRGTFFSFVTNVLLSFYWHVYYCLPVWQHILKSNFSYTHICCLAVTSFYTKTTLCDWQAVTIQELTVMSCFQWSAKAQAADCRKVSTIWEVCCCQSQEIHGSEWVPDTPSHGEFLFCMCRFFFVVRVADDVMVWVCFWGRVVLVSFFLFPICFYLISS